MCFKRIIFRSSDVVAMVVRDEDDIPHIGDVLDSACNSLDHTVPDFMLYENLHVDEIICILSYN